MSRSGDSPEVFDENGYDAYYEDWLWGCMIDNQKGIASNGERVTAALALRIAADLLRFVGGDNDTPLTWTHNDFKLARAAIAGIRSQHGIMGPDATALGQDINGLYATEQVDIWVYG